MTKKTYPRLLLFSAPPREALLATVRSLEEWNDRPEHVLRHNPGPRLIGMDSVGLIQRHDPGHTTQGRRPEDARPSRPSRYLLWSTALTDVSAYVTRLDPRRHRASILRIAR